MTTPHEQIAELQEKARRLPLCPARVALLEEAVQLADVVQDVELAYSTRDELMKAACFSGRSDIMLVAFSWSLAQYDRSPDRFSQHDILWKYKWVITNGYEFPEMSRSRLELLLADMERRYREAGSTMHAVSLVRRKLHEHFGEWQQARAAHADFRKRHRDSLSDCPACVASANCKYYFGQRLWGRAVRAVQPVLENQLTCMEEPHYAFGRVLYPLFHLDRVEEAKTYQRQGYRLVGRANHFVEAHADHLRFLVLIGDMAQAKRLLERHLPGALESVEPDSRFKFLLSARLWIDRLADRRTRTLKVRLPQGPPAPDASGNSDVNTLREWFTAQCQDIARRFDARNGTDAFQQQIEELPALLRLALD